MSRARENVDKLRDGDFTGLGLTADSLTFAGGSGQLIGDVDIVGDAEADSIKVANAASADPLRLDWYEEGTFTPRMLFNTVEASYSNRVGLFTRVGNIVYFSVFINIANKNGALDTDFIRVVDFPYSASTSPSAGFECSVFVTQMSGLTGVTKAKVRRQGGETQLVFFQSAGASGDGGILNAISATNSTSINANGFYRVE
jgi:hypothetical protein